VNAIPWFETRRFATLLIMRDCYDGRQIDLILRAAKAASRRIEVVHSGAGLLAPMGASPAMTTQRVRKYYFYSLIDSPPGPRNQ